MSINSNKIKFMNRSDNKIKISLSQFMTIYNNFKKINLLLSKNSDLHRYDIFECNLIDDILKLSASNKNNEYLIETYKLNPNKDGLYEISTLYSLNGKQDQQIDLLSMDEIQEMIFEILLNYDSLYNFVFNN